MGQISPIALSKGGGEITFQHAVMRANRNGRQLIPARAALDFFKHASLSGEFSGIRRVATGTAAIYIEPGRKFGDNVIVEKQGQLGGKAFSSIVFPVPEIYRGYSDALIIANQGFSDEGKPNYSYEVDGNRLVLLLREDSLADLMTGFPGQGGSYPLHPRYGLPFLKEGDTHLAPYEFSVLNRAQRNITQVVAGPLTGSSQQDTLDFSCGPEGKFGAIAYSERKIELGPSFARSFIFAFKEAAHEALDGKANILPASPLVRDALARVLEEFGLDTSIAQGVQSPLLDGPDGMNYRKGASFYITSLATIRMHACKRENGFSAVAYSQKYAADALLALGKESEVPDVYRMAK